MKCPKCGYHSFDYLDSCKKCGGDLREHKGRFGLRGSIFTGQDRQGAGVAPPATASSSPDKPQAASETFPESKDATTFGDLPTVSEHLAAGEISLPEPAPDDSVSPAREPLPGFQEFTLEEPPPDGGSAEVAPEEPDLDLAGRFFDSLALDAENPPAGSPASPEALFPPADWLSAAPDLAEVAGGRNPVDHPVAEISLVEAASERGETEIVLPQPGVQWRRRLVAGGIDLLILGLAWFLFLLTGELLFFSADGIGEVFDFSHLLELAIPYYLIFFALAFGYFTLFHHLIGQTPGKMFLRLRVEAVEGSGLALSQAFLRSVGGLASLLAAGLGFWRIFFDSEGRGWNDLLAGTRVVAARSPGAPGDSDLPETEEIPGGGSLFS